MFLEIFIYLWTEFHTGLLFKKAARMLALFCLLILPLLYLNIALARQGMRPAPMSLTIQPSQAVLHQ
jgi:hypothetical protein